MKGIPRPSVAETLNATRPYSYIVSSILLVVLVYLSWIRSWEGLAAGWFLLILIAAAFVLSTIGHSIMSFLVWVTPLYSGFIRIQFYGISYDPLPYFFALWFLGGIGFLLFGSWMGRRHGLLGPSRRWEGRPKSRAIRGALLGLIAGTLAVLLQALFTISFSWGPALRGELVDASMQTITIESLTRIVLMTTVPVGLALGGVFGALASMAYFKLTVLSWVERGTLVGLVLLLAGSLPFGMDLFLTFFLSPPLWLTFGLLHSCLYESGLAARLTHSPGGPSSAL